MYIYIQSYVYNRSACSKSQVGDHIPKLFARRTQTWPWEITMFNRNIILTWVSAHKQVIYTYIILYTHINWELHTLPAHVAKGYPPFADPYPYLSQHAVVPSRIPRTSAAPCEVHAGDRATRSSWENQAQTKRRGRTTRMSNMIAAWVDPTFNVVAWTCALN